WAKEIIVSLYFINDDGRTGVPCSHFPQRMRATLPSLRSSRKLLSAASDMLPLECLRKAFSTRGKLLLVFLLCALTRMYSSTLLFQLVAFNYPHPEVKRESRILPRYSDWKAFLTTFTMRFISFSRRLG
ncbi:MAG: hypothetical protein QG670_2109, partial [Thermoproteota archaeon]|nr:hypothetical protein [Thermoproteota archaeon]